MNKGIIIMRCFAGGLAACFIASSTFASITSFSAVPVPGAPAGYVTTDLKATFTGQYTGAQLLTPVLPAGSIYQDAAGTAAPPSALFVGVFPTLAFDTYVAQGGALSGGPDGEPSLGGGAVDLGGAPGAVFTSSQINQAWNPAGGVNISDRTDFLLARLTLKADLNLPLGQLIALASAGGEPMSIQGSVVNGGVVFGGVDAPVITPLNLSNPDSCLNCSVNGMVMLDPSSDPADSFGGTISFLGYNPDFGAPASASGKNLDPVWDAAQQKFTWDTTGSTRGTYQWQVSASNAGGEGLGVITVEQHAVPEPATLALVGLALVGLAGCRRQK